MVGNNKHAGFFGWTLKTPPLNRRKNHFWLSWLGLQVAWLTHAL